MGAVGVDFGTSNSACAIQLSSGKTERVFLETGSRESPLVPSWWYYPEGSHEPLFGHEARDAYIASGYSGRFITSVKSHLRDLRLRSTVIAGKPVTLEEMVASLLRYIRQRVEEQWGSVDQVFAGRPVSLGDDQVHDRKVEDRLRMAYVQAGYPDPVFIPEPIAAASAYKRQMRKSEIVFVADFGGGTLDYSLMRLTPHGSPDPDEVVGVSGARIGGEDMTAALVKIFWSDFGYGSQLLDFSRTKYLPVPLSYYTDLSRWTNLFRIQKFRQKVADTVQWGCTDPEGLQRLLALIEDEHYFAFLSQIDDLKVALSRSDSVDFVYDVHPISIHRTVRRKDFELQIEPLIDRARRVLETAFEGTTLSVTNVDSVFLTGGSSQIPLFRMMIEEVFGQDKLRHGDVFTSVAEGLAVSMVG